MNGATASAALLFLVPALLASCADSESQTGEQLESRVQELEGQLDGARSKAAELRDELAQLHASASDLTSQTSRFDGTNWREVVPSVRAAAGEIDSEAERAVASAEELVSQLN